jgi:hypothetical protein
MSVSKVTLTHDSGVVDIEFIGGGKVQLTKRASAGSKKALAVLELHPLPQFATGRATLVGAVMNTLASGVDQFDSLGTVYC